MIGICRVKLSSRQWYWRLIRLGLLVTGFSTSATAQTQDPALQSVSRALADAERGQLTPTAIDALNNHPLAHWIQYANLVRTIDQLDPAQAQHFLVENAGQPVARLFLTQWLAALARRQNWSAFLALWVPSGDINLRCAYQHARLASQQADSLWAKDVQQIWLSTGTPLAQECDEVIRAFQARGYLTDALLWQRLELAATAQQPQVMRDIANQLSVPERSLANQYAAFIQSADDRPSSWPKTNRSRLIAAAGLMALASQNPDAAEALLKKIESSLRFTATQISQIRYQIALWSAASYLPQAAHRLAVVPHTAYDNRLREWRVREAIARHDFPAAIAAIKAMPATQRDNPHWRYLLGRLYERVGDAARATALYRLVATSSTFDGFLAADILHQPYTLCPWTIDLPAPAKQSITQDPRFQRAIALYQINRLRWAQLEWDAYVKTLNDQQRRLAVAVANDLGWYDRAVHSLGKQPEELRLYSLRFPQAYVDIIRQQAALNGIEPAWIAAQIRAESTFNVQIQSSANALGLMQILPATANAIAQHHALSDYQGTQSLFDPSVNIHIGAVYLRELLDQYQLPHFAIAAYNAGPTATQRWLDQRTYDDPEFWIETIPYRETRDYVSRVLAFSVIYDWRLNANALPLSARLHRQLSQARKAFVCPTAH